MSIDALILVGREGDRGVTKTHSIGGETRAMSSHGHAKACRFRNEFVVTWLMLSQQGPDESNQERYRSWGPLAIKQESSSRT